MTNDTTKALQRLHDWAQAQSPGTFFGGDHPIAVARETLSGAALASAAQPAARRWPPVSGVGRDAGHSRAVVVYLAAEPTDDEMRALHDAVRGEAVAALASAAQPVASVSTHALVEQCRRALAEELMAWDIDPPLHHVKEAHDACVAWLAAAPKAAPAAQGDALPREDFAWMVVQEACETEPADEDDPECIRILRRDLKSAVLAALLRHGTAAAARAAKEGA